MQGSPSVLDCPPCATRGFAAEREVASDRPHEVEPKAFDRCLPPGATAQVVDLLDDLLRREEKRSERRLKKARSRHGDANSPRH